MTVEQIIARAGGARRLAQAVGVHYASVYDWRRNGEIPIKRVPAVARATHLLPSDIRPDFFDFDATHQIETT